jgi:hypothetical protein
MEIAGTSGLYRGAQLLAIPVQHVGQRRKAAAGFGRAVHEKYIDSNSAGVRQRTVLPVTSCTRSFAACATAISACRIRVE